jgi:molybdenum cofactor sulfurtransferase
MNYQPRSFAHSSGLELSQFLIAHPEYSETSSLDEIRKTGFSRLDEQGHVYLDYTGGGLYDIPQIEEHAEMLKNGVFGNPHSSNPTSRAITETIERTRGRVLEYFNADPDEFCAIFTSNATGAIKIVAESYPFGPTGRYLLTFDNHNSVNGIREFARARGSEVTYVPVQLPDLRIDDGELRKTLASNTSAGDVAGPKLFAYPAQSNMSGVQHSLEWIEEAHESGWDVLLDAAAFVSCSELDISRWKPDFVPISFYKIFGYPTGIGCLIARKSALEKLEKPWFAGGTISISSVQADQHHLEESEAAFEEGTVNYLSLPAVGIGLDSMESAGLDNIHKRVGALTSLLLDQLSSIVHVNGQPLIRIYGPTDMNSRGGTVSVNFYDPEGTLIDHRVVEELANERLISIRTRCFCNPGAGEIAFGLSEEELRAAFNESDQMSFEQFLEFLEKDGDKRAGAVRISLGRVSTFDDVRAFIDFAHSFLDRPSSALSS